MPNPNYMDDQPKLTWEMRGVLNDWLIQVHARFRLNPETLFLCTNLIDRFLSTRAAVHNTFNVQRHLTSRATLRALRGEALQTWRAATAA